MVGATIKMYTVNFQVSINIITTISGITAIATTTGRVRNNDTALSVR